MHVSNSTVYETVTRTLNTINDLGGFKNGTIGPRGPPGKSGTIKNAAKNKVLFTSNELLSPKYTDLFKYENTIKTSQIDTHLDGYSNTLQVYTFGNKTNPVYLAADDSTIKISHDLIQFFRFNIPDMFTESFIRDIIWDGKRFIIIGAFNDNSNIFPILYTYGSKIKTLYSFKYSTFYENFTAHKIAYNSSVYTLIADINGAYSNWYSYDFYSWFQGSPNPGLTGVESLIWTGTIFLTNTGFYSTDGIHYQAFQTSFPADVKRVGWDGNAYYAVTDTGDITLYSTTNIANIVNNSFDLDTISPLSQMQWNGKNLCINSSNKNIQILYDYSNYQVLPDGLTVYNTTWLHNKFISINKLLYSLEGLGYLPLSTPEEEIYRLVQSNTTSPYTITFPVNNTILGGSGSMATMISLNNSGLPLISTDSVVYSMCWGKNIFVAVGIFSFSGINNSIIYSYDGINWYPCETSIKSYYGIGTSICFNGNMFVSCGTKGDSKITNNLGYSYDGINWTTFDSDIFPEGCSSVTWGLDKFVAVGYNTEGTEFLIAESEDGVNWIKQLVSKVSTLTIRSYSLNCVASSSIGFVAGGDNLTCLKLGTDGIWFCGIVLDTDVNDNVIYDVYMNDQFYILVGDKIIYTGIFNKSVQTITIPYGISRLYSIIWSGNMFIAAGYKINGDHTEAIYITSPDGINWVSFSTMSVMNEFRCVCWNGNSDDLSSPGQYKGYVQGYQRILFAYKNKLTNKPELLYSDDGENWLLTFTDNTDIGTPVAHCWNGNVYLLSIETDTQQIFYISEDCISWIKGTFSTDIIKDVVWIGDKYVGVSVSGLWTSVDGLKWIKVLNVSNTAKQMCFDGQYVYLTSDETIYLYEPIMNTLISYPIIPLIDTVLTSIEYIRGIFIASGHTKNDQYARIITCVKHSDTEQFELIHEITFNEGSLGDTAEKISYNYDFIIFNIRNGEFNTPYYSADFGNSWQGINTRLERDIQVLGYDGNKFICSGWSSMGVIFNAGSDGLESMLFDEYYRRISLDSSMVSNSHLGFPVVDTKLYLNSGSLKTCPDIFMDKGYNNAIIKYNF